MKEMTRCFLKGLNYSLRGPLLILDHLSFHDLLNRALILESDQITVALNRKRKLSELQMEFEEYPSKQRLIPQPDQLLLMEESQESALVLPSTDTSSSMELNTLASGVVIEKKRDNLTCFHCGKIRHYAQRCPQRKRDVARGKVGTLKTKQSSRMVIRPTSFYGDGVVNHLTPKKL